KAGHPAKAVLALCRTGAAGKPDRCARRAKWADTALATSPRAAERGDAIMQLVHAPIGRLSPDRPDMYRLMSGLSGLKEGKAGQNRTRPGHVRDVRAANLHTSLHDSAQSGRKPASSGERLANHD